MPKISRKGAQMPQSPIRKLVPYAEQAKKEGGKLLAGGNLFTGEGYDSGCYVQPAIVEMSSQTNIVKEETFAPILYMLPYETLDEAIAVFDQYRKQITQKFLEIQNQLPEASPSSSG